MLFLNKFRVEKEKVREYLGTLPFESLVCGGLFSRLSASDREHGQV